MVFAMLGRVLLLTCAAGLLAAACGGRDFQGDEGESAGEGGSGGEPPVAVAGAGSGGASAGGSASPGGAPGHAGAEEAGGAGGVVGSTPIVVVRESRTSIVGNSDASMMLSMTPSAGNALIVGITCFTEVENCVIEEGGVTDNQGNLYRLVVEGSSIVSSDTHGSRGYLFIAENIPEPMGQVTITVNPLGEPETSFQNFAWGVLEVSGLLPLNSVDQTGTFPNTCCFTSTTVTTDGPTVQANELAVAVHTARSNDNDFNYGHEPEWTEHHVNNDGLSLASQHSLVARVLSEPGVVSHTWTHDEPTRGVSAIIATFRGASD